MIRSFLAVLVVCLVSPGALACTCAPPPRQALRSASAVFAGTVLSVTALGNAKTVVFAVERTWKGAASSTMVVSTADSTAACGYPFHTGQRYLVYAWGGITKKTNLCSRTRTLAEAQPDLAALGAGSVPVSNWLWLAGAAAAVLLIILARRYARRVRAPAGSPPVP